jgi:hypothetical protein
MRTTSHVVLALSLGIAICDLGQEEVDPLVGESGRRVDRGQRLDAERPMAGLLEQLAGRAVDGVLAWLVEDPRGDLEQGLPHRFADLPDQENVAGRGKRDDRARARVMDDLSLAGRPRLDLDRDEVALEDPSDGLRLHAGQDLD